MWVLCECTERRGIADDGCYQCAGIGRRQRTKSEREKGHDLMSETDQNPTQLVEFEARPIARELFGDDRSGPPAWLSKMGVGHGEAITLVAEAEWGEMEPAGKDAVWEVHDAVLASDADLAANIKERWARALMTESPGVQGLVRLTEEVVDRCSAAEDELVELRADDDRQRSTIAAWESWAKRAEPHSDDCQCPGCVEAPLSSPDAPIAFIDKDIEDEAYPRAMLIDEIKKLREAVLQGGRHTNNYLANEAAYERSEREKLRADLHRLETAAAHDHGGWLMGMLSAAKCARKLGLDDFADDLIRAGAVEVVRATEPDGTPTAGPGEVYVESSPSEAQAEYIEIPDEDGGL